MKKVFTFALLALMGMSICYAQYTKEKVTVAVGEFTGKNAAAMRSAALTAMPTCRVNAVDLNNVDKDKVDYIITGRIADPTTEKKTSTLTGDYWATTVNFNLQITDARTGKVMATRDASSIGTDNGSKDASVNDALKFQDQDMRRLIDKGCPVRVPLVGINEAKKDKANTAYIEGGEMIGVCDGLYFDVQVETEIAGKKVYKTIGSAKVKEVMGEEMAEISITKGNKEIKKNFDEGIQMVVTSKEEPWLHF